MFYISTKEKEKKYLVTNRTNMYTTHTQKSTKPLCKKPETI